MTVRFILGTSGTGKTYYCMDRIAAELRSGPAGPALILLVPEQATHQSVLGILSHARVEGFHRLKILSFDRLRQLVLGSNLATKQLSEIGRQMLIQRILSDLSDQIGLLGHGSAQTGLAVAMAEVISALYDQAVSDGQLDQVASALGSRAGFARTAAKLAGIRLVLKEYITRLQDRFIDPQVELARTRQAIRNDRWLKGARLWVDGFAGFTASELLILQDLLSAVSHADIALCLDPDAIDINDPYCQLTDQTRTFYPTELTYARLLAGIKCLGLALEEPVLLRTQMRFGKGTSLAHLEASIFRRKVKVKADGTIQIWAAPDRRTEVEAVARQIRRIVQEAGLRYNQIAILCPDLAAYEAYLRAYLSRFSIPFFLDTPRPLSRHPLAVLVISALEIVAGGFQTSDVMTYLKTGLVPIDQQRLDELECYCGSFGIGPADWLSQTPWAFHEPERPRFDQAQIDATRNELIGPLLGLKADLAGEVTASDLVAALSRLLDRLGVQSAVGRWIETAVQAGDQSAGQEHQQACSLLAEILQQLKDIFGDMKAGLQQWLSILKAAISRANLTLIPPTLDQVLVGTIDRSRHPELDVAFVIGATQDDFPRPLPKAGLLTEMELEVIGQEGLELGHSVSEVLSSWRYLGYVAFTRARRLLVVSYPKQDQTGAALHRSPLVDEILDLFEGLEEQDLACSCSQRFPLDWYDLMDLVLNKGIDRGQLTDVLADCCPQSVARWIEDPLGTRAQEVLDTDVARSIFADGLATSATRLGTFARCPFRYFARYILELEPPRRLELRPLDLGDLYHRVLQQVVSQCLDTALQEGTEWLKQQVRAIIMRIVDEDPLLSRFASTNRYNRFQIERTCQTLVDCVSDLLDIYRAGSFRPYLFEAGFGGKMDPLGQARLALPDGRPVVIRGKIDRIDLAEDRGQRVAVVTDYKTSEHTFDWSGLYHGLDLQLPIYLIAIGSASEAGLIDAEPVGAFYLQVELLPDRYQEGKQLNRRARGIFDGRYHRLLDIQAKGQSRFYSFHVDRKGEPYAHYARRDVLRPDHFKAVLAHAKKVALELAGQILSGLISARPVRCGNKIACEDCDYMSFCRFDQTFGQYRELETIDKGRFIDRLGGGNG